MWQTAPVVSEHSTLFFVKFFVLRYGTFLVVPIAYIGSTCTQQKQQVDCLSCNTTTCTVTVQVRVQLYYWNKSRQTGTTHRYEVQHVLCTRTQKRTLKVFEIRT
jgi:hypothetical protein